MPKPSLNLLPQGSGLNWYSLGQPHKFNFGMAITNQVKLWANCQTLTSKFTSAKRDAKINDGTRHVAPSKQPKQPSNKGKNQNKSPPSKRPKKTDSSGHSTSANTRAPVKTPKRQKQKDPPSHSPPIQVREGAPPTVNATDITGPVNTSQLNDTSVVEDRSGSGQITENSTVPPLTKPNLSTDITMRGPVPEQVYKVEQNKTANTGEPMYSVPMGDFPSSNSSQPRDNATYVHGGPRPMQHLHSGSAAFLNQTNRGGSAPVPPKNSQMSLVVPFLTMSFMLMFLPALGSPFSG